MEKWDRLWTGVHLATMTGPRSELGAIRDGAIASTNGRIAWIGREVDLDPSRRRNVADIVGCDGAWMTPGLIDCHTHLVFGGDRLGDFHRRLSGESYSQIARSGGGILSTVAATRRASMEELVDSAATRARDLSAWGVTTIEIKSGYGLELTTELRMLEAAMALRDRLPVNVSPTLLAAHAVPPRYEGRSAEYVEFVVEEILPAALERELAVAVDVFLEAIAFSRDEARTVLEAGMERGLLGRLHADQLTDMNGGLLAAELGARSADHLEHLSEDGARAMADAGVCAVLLPGAAHTLGEERTPPVAALRREGVAMAVASDVNPGSSPITHVGLILNLACIRFGLVPAEVLHGYTSVAARVLGLEDDRGTLEVGKRADLALWNVDDPARLCYWVGASPLREVVKDGEPVGPPVALA